MAKERTASEIQQRFCDEQNYIERYTQFLRAKSTIHDEQIVELNRILKRVNIEPLPVRRYDRTAEPYSPKETDALLGAIRNIEPEVYQTIIGHEQFLDHIPSFEFDRLAANHLDNLGEWVDYILTTLPYNPDEQDDDAILQAALLEYERSADQDMDEEDRISPDELRSLITLAIQHAKHVQVRQQVDAMVYAREQFEDLELLARVAKPDAEVNVLRQGFLLLMTAFDAAVFDMVRIGFKRKFFYLIGTFGKQEKTSLEVVGEAGSFEAWRDQIIEEQLKKRYVKDLLGVLQALDVNLVDESHGDRHAQLIELVLRRNVHIHNRGEVDERYLEQYNLYNLKLGDVASIDLSYFDMANRLCQNCVNLLSEWASC